MTLNQALEKLYIPRDDLGQGSRDLLIPFRNRVSKVTVKPTKKSTYDAHYPYFRIQPPVTNNNTTKDVKNRIKDGQASQEDLKATKREEAKVLREEGGAAAASAKKVGVNKEFFRQLRSV